MKRIYVVLGASVVVEISRNQTFDFFFFFNSLSICIDALVAGVSFELLDVITIAFKLQNVQTMQL